MPYEKLLNEAYQQKIDIYEEPMQPNIKGLYSDNVIWINKIITATNQKYCVLAEELGHYHTSTGNILNQSKIENRKQEKVARLWAYKKVIPLSKIIEAYKYGVQSKHELADFLSVTEEFLLEAIERYKEKYGLYATKDCYVIYFEPLAVMELFDDFLIKDVRKWRHIENCHLENGRLE